MKNYKCKACKKVNTEVLQSQKGILWYKYDFTNKEWETQEHDGEEVLGYYCRECGNQLDEKTSGEIDTFLNE